MNVLRSLSHRPFALLWFGQTTSRLGDSLHRIALAWWVLEKTGSAAAMGTVLVLSQIPLLLFLLVGGVVVDRLPRIRIMFLSDLLSGSVVTFIAVSSWLGTLEIWHIYAASLIFGLVEAFFFPAYQAVIPQITPPDMLNSANSLNGVSARMTGVIGPLLGASLVAAGGTPLAFALDAASFFVSALFVLPLLRSQTERQADAHLAVRGERKPVREVIRGGLADLRQGWDAIVTIPWIWVTIVIFGFLNIMEASPRAVSMPFLIRDNLHADVTLLGIFGSAFSIGYVAGSLWFGRYTRLRQRGPVGYVSSMVSGLMLLLFAWQAPVIYLIAAMVVYGLNYSVFGLIWNNTLQEMVPHDRLGRVYSIDALGSWVLLPIGFALAGWATDRFGAPLVFLIGGFGTIALTALGLFHPAIRGLD
jgi:MFS family permease